MASTDQNQGLPSFEGTKIVTVDLSSEMRKSFLEYSMSVIVARALPDVRDGLKPVHRRIIYTMFESGITPDKPHKKCAATVGDVLGKYHPHSDTSVYDALVRLGQDFSLRYPLVDKHGNFGSIDGDPPAAYRYTEARMSRLAMAMVTDINKETVDFKPNYDDNHQEPVVLPSRFPNLLVNGCTGIAVGMATNIPPHNFGETVNAILAQIDNPDITLEELMFYIKGPDFPTGGIIMGKSGIRSAYGTGRGKLTLRAKASIEEDDRGRSAIVVTEIPYMISKARILENIAELVKDKRIDGISVIRDESDRDGLRMVFELKRDASPQIVLNQLYHYSSLQETVGVIMMALHNNQPKVMTLKEILKHYIDFQGEVIIRRTQYDLRKAKERAHVLEGLKIALDFIEEVVRIIRTSKDIPSSKLNLMERFGMSDIQASAVTAMPLGRLSGLERAKIEEELAGILDKIKEYEAILGDYDLVMEILKKELAELRDKYSDERRTEIRSVEGEVDIEDLIPEEDCVVTLTHFGYVKRQPSDAYKIQRRGGRGILGMKQRDEDFAEELFIASTHDSILFFTNQGRMFKLKCYEIPEGGRTSRGTNIINLLALNPDEKVTSLMRVREFDPKHYLVMVTKQGIIKRTSLDAYKNIRKTGLIAISLAEGDELSYVHLTDGEQQLLIATQNGMAIRFAETDVRPLGRSAMGVKAIRLKEGDCIVGMEIVKEGDSIVTITDKGQGRRTLLSEYPIQSRHGLGKINYKVSEAKGQVCGIKAVSEKDDLILISTDGVIIRIAAAEVNLMSRYASGVRVMRLGENDRVVTFTRADHAEEETEPIAAEEEDGQEELLAEAEAEAEEKAMEAEETAEEPELETE